MAFQPPSPDDVLFIDDLARVLKTSRRTIEKLRRAGALPIPEIVIDKRARWSAEAVRRFLDGQRVVMGSRLRKVG